MTDGQTGWVALASLAAGLTLGARWVGQAVAERRADSWIIRRLGLQGRVAALSEPARPDDEAARAARRVEELLGHVTQAVVAVDGRDRLMLANPGARELLRLGDAGAGEPFVPLARSAELVDFLRQVRGGEGATREIELNRAPASNIWIRIAAAPLKADPRLPGAVVLIAEDITRLRRLESLGREFVANVSHDLRTPVTIVRGYAETLAQDHASLSPEERARFIAKVVSATGRLSSLLEGMLALASLESVAAVQRSPGALAEAAAEVTEAMADRARAAGLGLRVEILDRDGQADPILARRLVQNLVDNAVTHARGASEVVVRVRGPALEVEDNGDGVAPADLARLFDRFYRADRSRKQGGAGIGLSIVRQIAELHGGGVSAEPVRPKGLRIRVTLAPN